MVRIIETCNREHKLKSIQQTCSLLTGITTCCIHTPTVGRHIHTPQVVATPTPHSWSPHLHPHSRQPHPHPTVGRHTYTPTVGHHTHTPQVVATPTPPQSVATPTPHRWSPHLHPHSRQPHPHNQQPTCRASPELARLDLPSSQRTQQSERTLKAPQASTRVLSSSSSLASCSASRADELHSVSSSFITPLRRRQASSALHQGVKQEEPVAKHYRQ